MWFVTPLFITLFVFASVSGQAMAFTRLTSQMGVGAQSADVTNLQTFLASNGAVYPAGLVTGYYGPMTEAAVRNFQIGYGISALGNVGPQTQMAVNAVIDSGRNIDVSNPAIFGVSVSPSTRSATVSWNNSESAKAQVFYSTSQITSVESAQAKTAPYISGSVVTDNTFSMNKTMTIDNLQSGTAYSYVIEVTDTSGNVSVTMPGVFVTK